MSTVLTPTETAPLVLHFGPILKRMSDHDFFEFCQRNTDFRIERTSSGDLIIMPPTGGYTGRSNFKLSGLFYIWVEADGTGVGFDSSTGFTLPNGAERSPDVAWVKRARWEALTEDEKIEFPPICPDFVIELRSASDTLSKLQDKMQEYIDNGAQLGWLIDPKEKKVHIYRPNLAVEILDNPPSVSDSFLPGFVLLLHKVW